MKHYTRWGGSLVLRRGIRLASGVLLTFLFLVAVGGLVAIIVNSGAI